jgi:hypothetical protein
MEEGITKKYQPTPEEMHKAESIMSDEQKRQSREIELEKIRKVREQIVGIIDSFGLDTLKKRFEKSKLDVDVFVEILSRTDIDKFTIIQKYIRVRERIGTNIVPDYLKSPIRVYLDDPLRAYKYKDTLRGTATEVTRTEYQINEGDSSLLGECPQHTKILTEGDEIFDRIIKGMEDKWEISYGDTEHEIRIVFERK